jgi:hypothetical protein
MCLVFASEAPLIAMDFRNMGSWMVIEVTIRINAVQNHDTES